MILALCLILTLLTVSLADVGVHEIARRNHFSGTVALVLAFMVALTIGLLVNANLFPVAP